MPQLKVDDLGQPIPQYMSNSTGEFEAIRGKDGAMATYSIETPTDGIYKVKLFTSDGVPLPFDTVGIPVKVSQHAVNNYVWNGTDWVQQAPFVQKVPGYNANILASAARTASVDSVVIKNEAGAKTAFVLIDITAATGTLASMTVKIPINGTNVVYKTITFATPLTVGKSIVTFGIDETNKAAIPQSFVIGLVPTDANSVTYAVDIQLS